MLPARSANPLIFIFITRVIDAIGFGIVMPVLPQLLLSMGAPNVAVATRIAGYLLGVYALCQFVCGPVVGNLSDRFGRRPVILASLLAFGFDYFLMGFAPTIGWLFLGRAVAGMAGAVFVPANAFVADITPPERRAKAFGLIGAAFGFGFILGPAIGGVLGVLGPRAPFFGASGLALINLVFGYFVLPESLPPERRRAFSWARANPLGAALALRHFPALLGLALVMLLYLLGNNVYPSTWAFYMSLRFNWPTYMIGLSLAATGIGMVVVQALLTGRLVARFGERNAAIFGLAIAASNCIAYISIPYAWLVFPISIAGGFQAVAFPSLNALLTHQVPITQQGELQGALASLSSLAAIFGPFAMTQTFAHFSAPGAHPYFPGAAFMLASLLNLSGLTLLILQTRRLRMLSPAGIAN
ncbi:MAG: TCR/Tet family MFS transporter [Alphaproteobacteria bacterium]|nr:TCR/Tet family MFS transporter [Alphaproteobacteria bacterium]